MGIMMQQNKVSIHEVSSPALNPWYGQGKNGSVDEAPAGHSQVDFVLDLAAGDANIVQDLRQEVPEPA